MIIIITHCEIYLNFTVGHLNIVPKNNLIFNVYYLTYIGCLEMIFRLVISVCYIRINSELIIDMRDAKLPSPDIYFTTMYDLYHLIRTHRYTLD